MVLIKASLKAIGIPFSNATLCRMERRGLFPRRFYLSQKTPVWKASDVIAWIAERAASAGAPNTTTEQATKGKVRRRLQPKNREAEHA